MLSSPPSRHHTSFHWPYLLSGEEKEGFRGLRPRTPLFFGLDAISADGRSLYLIQKLAHAGPQAYQVRVYDVARKQLAPRPLAESGDPASHIIRGVDYTRVWSHRAEGGRAAGADVDYTRVWFPRGDWLFTLYVEPGHGGVFIHALGVAYRRVHCSMLNTPGVPSDLARFTPAVDPNGATLYVIDAALGRAIAVHGFPDGRHDAIYLGRRALGLQGARTGMVMSHDGHTLFLATLNGVWRIDTQHLTIRRVHLAGRQIISLALSPDGERLYALARHLGDGGSIVAIDTTGGHVMGVIGRLPAQPAGLAIARLITQD